LKVFRRVEPGPNPDVEIGEYLTEQTFGRVPSLMGSISYVPGPQGPGLPDSPALPSSIAMLQEYVWNQGNAWQVTIEELGRYLERVGAQPLPADARADEANAWAFGRLAEPPGSVIEAISAYLATADILGRRTGELHVALAGNVGNPAFAPQPMTKEDLKATIDVMRRHGEEHLNLLEAVLPRLDDRVHDAAREALEQRDAILHQFDDLRGLTEPPTRIRCHGDYHLGQVLVTEGDVVIIDFEGEPARPLEQRRAKSSPLRDVAGMLRSFSYAALTAITAATETRPDDAKRLAPWADLWQTWVSATFLRAYLAATHDAEFLPPPGDFAVLLRAYMLEKALYELAYELNNRPAWVHIPLTGIAQVCLKTAEPVSPTTRSASHEVPSN
jgi:maltose alpha-D-glucosyltransferase/alpha-amylase